MKERVNYEMTEADLEKLIEASKPTPCIMIGSYVPPTPQENANIAWARLGEKMGFDPMTVQPILGKCERFFSAVPVEGEDEQDIESTRSDVADALVKAAEKVVLAIDEAQIVWILDAGKKLKAALAAYRGEVNE